MSFQYPLGLLGLIGIPIIVLIYIIKNKHTEQIVTSNYLWHLSEKFLNKKRPVSLVSGIISLILQIVAITTISLVIAHPIIYIPNGAKDYCFILDASGSMNMVCNDVSRMDLGKEEIKNIINESSDGSKYTLIYAGENSRVVYEKFGNKEKACELLDDLKPCGMTVSYDKILKHVQGYFNENKSMITYLITDKDYESSNIEIINVSDNLENYGISNFEYVAEKSTLKVNANVMSYESDATIELDLYVDDVLVDSKSVSSTKLVEAQYTYESDILDFSSLKLVIKNNDGLLLDNSSTIYNVEKEHNYSTLIVSYRPFYLESMLKTVGNTSITVISPDNYSYDTTGYSLYIFDAVTPTVLPSDGTIWLFRPTESIDGSGFSVQDLVEDENGIALTYPKNSTSMFKTLTYGLEKEPIYVTKYMKYGLYKNFTTLLTHEGNPIIFTGTTNQGIREVVFAFDLHDSNLPLLMDYLILYKNLVDYSFPIILDKSSYICGEEVKMNVLSNCDSIKVASPNGDTTYLDVSKEITSFKTTLVGTYTISMNFNDEIKEFYIYSNLPVEESTTINEIESINLDGELENEYNDGIYDKLIILFIILAIVYVADWMVYCREQYQLR